MLISNTTTSNNNINDNDNNKWVYWQGIHDNKL